LFEVLREDGGFDDRELSLIASENWRRALDAWWR
jgi:hypothetical protein